MVFIKFTANFFNFFLASSILCQVHNLLIQSEFQDLCEMQISWYHF